MMVGTTIGMMKKKVTARPVRRGSWPRPSAIIVPRVVDSAAVSTATTALVPSEPIHSGRSKNSRYQCRVKPRGGKVMKLVSVKEIGATANVGSTRNTQIAAAKAVSIALDRRPVIACPTGG